MKAMIRFKTAALFLCAALLTPILASCGSVQLSPEANSSIFISEAVSSNVRSLVHERLGTPDWVELYNASERDISLKGYGLSDNLREPHKWVFPEVTIPAGGYLVVYCDNSASGKEEPLCTDFGLSKAGETLFLSDEYYNLLQQLTLPELKSDVSYAMKDDFSYGYCAAPTPGAKNDQPVSDTLEGLIYGAGPDDLRLSEVLAKNKNIPASDGGFYPYAELYNSSSFPLYLSSFYLTDDETEPQKWQIEGETLQPGQYALIFFTGKEGVLNGGEICAPFKLGSEDTYLILYDSGFTECARLTWGLDMPEGVSVTEDGKFTAFPTPAAENSAVRFESLDFSDMTEFDPVRINEVLVGNRYGLSDEDGDRGAWVELYNGSDAAISLNGYYLSDELDSPFKWALPDTELASHAYKIVFLSGKDKFGEQLHSSFRLSKSDGMLVLCSKNGLKLDRVSYEPSIGDDISIGRDGTGAWKYFASPTPDAENTTHAFESLSAVQRVDVNGVYISEVCAVNAVKSGAADWIELYNGSSRDKKLDGWYLSDDPDVLSLFSLSGVVVPANGYAVINASPTGAEGVTAPFSVSAGGETLLLTDDNGVLSDAFETGVLRSGVTSGRIEGDGSGTRYFFTSATKKAANSAASAYPAYVMDPVFSDRTLYHSEAFTISISCLTSGAEIRYTLDGSLPDASSPLYTEPLTISKNTPVRAVALKVGLLNSKTVNATYLFEAPHTLPVVCLSMESSGFNTVYSVIDRWQKVERGGGSFEYYEADGKLGTALPCGLRVSGASTLLMRQKSLTIYFRGGYGASTADYPFFDSGAVNSYSSLVLRNSGQDANDARIADSFCMRAVKGLNIEAVYTRPVAVYINGQYWGLYDLNENQNEDYLASYYGVNPDRVDIIRRNETPLAGSRYDFKRVREFALNRDTSSDAAYAELCQWVDVDYFTDYLITQTYFCNGDMFNQKYWRSQDYAVKWRPVYFDLDLSFSSVTRNLLTAYFTVEGVPSRDGTLTNMDIFVGLKKNAAWREQFCKRYVYVVVNQFDPERLTAVLDELASEMEPEMERHIDRWGSPNSISRWKNELDDIRSFLQKRPDYALRNLQSTFGLSAETLQSYIDAAKAGNG
ncbi:MAG TPA: lamin tail domain-containing protein [Clostridia bacterium]|nr:lamin tail domain-containing protein [Clostridia bacterium]